jgi:hypothetical protein
MRRLFAIHLLKLNAPAEQAAFFTRAKGIRCGLAKASLVSELHCPLTGSCFSIGCRPISWS